MKTSIKPIINTTFFYLFSVTQELLVIHSPITVELLFQQKIEIMTWSLINVQ